MPFLCIICCSLAERLNSDNVTNTAEKNETGVGLSMKKQVTISGAGASGMTAAIFAARQGAQVTLLEHMDRVGKKILSTGNGKCNLSNRFMGGKPVTEAGG